LAVLTDEKAASLAQQLTTHPDYRVLRRLVPQTTFAEPAGRPLARGVIVDTETTGLNQDADKIMEIGLVVFEYDPETGQAYRVLESLGALEDPGIPITPEITEITGITNEMVAGKRIDDARVAELVLALGGKAKGDDATDAGYFAVRASMANAISEAARHLAEKGVTQKGAPAVIRLITQVAARISIVVSEKAAAQTIPVVGAVGGALINTLFLDHYQDMAKGHFIVRRMERKHGQQEVQRRYIEL
jgi:hypothetical protein